MLQRQQLLRLGPILDSHPHARVFRHVCVDSCLRVNRTYLHHSQQASSQGENGNDDLFRERDGGAYTRYVYLACTIRESKKELARGTRQKKEGRERGERVKMKCVRMYVHGTHVTSVMLPMVALRRPPRVGFVCLHSSSVTKLTRSAQYIRQRHV